MLGVCLGTHKGGLTAITPGNFDAEKQSRPTYLETVKVNDNDDASVDENEYGTVVDLRAVSLIQGQSRVSVGSKMRCIIYSHSLDPRMSAVARYTRRVGKPTHIKEYLAYPKAQ